MAGAFSIRKGKVYTVISGEEVYIGTVEKNKGGRFSSWEAFGIEGELVETCCPTRLDAFHGLHTHYMREYFNG